MLVVKLGLALLVNAYFLQFLLRRSMLFLLNFWDMAKLVRRLTLNQVSVGSSPTIPLKKVFASIEAKTFFIINISI